MKRRLLILGVTTLLCAAAAFGKDFYWATEIDDGSARSLDAISVDDLAHRDIAIVNQTESGQSTYMIFEFDANSTASATTAYHPYRIRPIDYDTKGVWYEHKAGYSTGTYENRVQNSAFVAWSRADGFFKMSGVSVDSVSAGVVTLAADPSITIDVGDMITFGGAGSNIDSTGVSVYQVVSLSGQTSFTLSNTGIDTGVTDAYFGGPGCTAADGDGPDYWRKDTTLDVYQEAETRYQKDVYALRLKPTNSNDWLQMQPDFKEDPWGYRDKTVTFGCWAKTSQANDVRFRIYDGDAYWSDYHSGSGEWEWIEVTLNNVQDDNGDYFVVRIYCVQGSGTVYIQHPMLIFGGSIGEGNYSYPTGEVIMFTDEITLSDYNGDTISADVTDVNIAEQTQGKVSWRVSDVLMNLVMQVGADDNSVFIGDTANGYRYLRQNSITSRYMNNQGWVHLKDDGSFDIDRNGTTTLWLYLIGIRLP